MLEIEMSKDIKEYQPKVVGPFTMRQIICLVIAVSYGIPLFMALKIDIEERMLITTISVVPTILCGWFKVHNEPFERFIWIVIKNKIIKPEKRLYKVRDIYELDTPVKKVRIKRTKKIKGYK